MTILFIISLFFFATWGVYVFIPNRGYAGFVASGVVVGAFLALVYLTKLVILA